jgi:molybdopterin-guanine dinucleotide biosynthesis protein A
MRGVSEKLPVHGFVLAGGKSSRMGTDKALLNFRGRSLVEIAVEKLRGFCVEVSIVGEREDLSLFAPVVTGERADCGPAAGIEAGLKAATGEWAMFVPVDVPLVPEELLRRWAEDVIAMGKGGLTVSYLSSEARAHPTFCMLRRDCLEDVSKILDNGERKLSKIFEIVGNVERFDEMHDRWFVNINTRQDLTEAEAWAAEQS